VTASEIERVALEIWVEREMQLPARVRRMVPDDFDLATGEWQRCLKMAVDRIVARRETRR